ncbi:MAG: DUF1801 domain-containing protein [Cellulosilyticaceae bacterium]
MNSKHEAVDTYVEGLEREAKVWTTYFVTYMRANHPELEEVISFKMPTYKLGSGKERNYIAFGYGKSHFSLHSMDFEYMAMIKEKLSKPGKGKGCVNIPFVQGEEKKIVLQAIEEIIERKISRELK